MVIKYENGKIYKIICNDPNEPCYVGSTTKTYLSQRMAKHVDSYTRWKKGQIYESKIMSFELFDKHGVENCKIILLELVNAKSKEELRRREQHHIENNNCVNKQRAFRTREEIKEYGKQYRTKNYDKKRAQDKKYYNDNKDKIKEMYKTNYIEKRDIICARVNKYRKANLEIIKARKKEYCLKNADKIRIKKQRKYYCTSCNYELTIIKRARHNRSNLHINNTIQYMESITEKYNKVQPIEIQHFTLE